jgi:hypothetical protein
MTDKTYKPNVYQCIAAVAADIAKEGIAKVQRNAQQGYNFRGIDAVYNSLAPLLARHGLVIIPRCVARTVTERQTKSGGALFYTTVEAEFDFVSADDCSKVTARTFGEAMDSGDKSTNKAMSAAYKYAAFQTFCIPTEGDNDADATTHEVQTRTLIIKPTRGETEIPDTRQHVCADAILGINERFNADDVAGAFEIYQQFTDPEEKVFIWDKLPSNIRSAIKKYGAEIREAV